MPPKKPIDGNVLIEQIRAEQAKPGSYGMIKNSETGEGIEITGKKGISQMQSAFTPTVSQANFGIPANIPTESKEAQKIYDQEEYEGGREMIMEQTGMGPGDPYNYEPMEDEELQSRKQEYLMDAGNISNYMEKMGQNINDVYNGLDEEVSKADMDLFKDARNIKTEDDAIRLGELNDMWMDMNGIDAEKYYQEGVLEECGADCQERRQMNKAQSDEYEESMILEGDQPMAMSDEEYNKAIKNMNF